MDLTSYADISKVVAAAVSNPDKTGNVTFVGNELSPKEVAEIYNKVRGTNVTPNCAGTLDENKKKFEEEIKTNFGAAIGIGILGLMADPKGKFKTNNNKDYPNIKPTSLEQFLKDHPEMSFPK